MARANSAAPTALPMTASGGKPGIITVAGADNESINAVVGRGGRVGTTHGALSEQAFGIVFGMQSGPCCTLAVVFTKSVRLLLHLTGLLQMHELRTVTLPIVISTTLP